MPLIIVEDKEQAYVEMFGGERIASLGGRGGSCANAMRRIASVNNNWCPGGMGGNLAHERASQTRIKDAGEFGAMGYIFESTNTEVFAYLAAQHLLAKRRHSRREQHDRPTGDSRIRIPALLRRRSRHARRAGDGRRVVREQLDEVLEGVNGSQYPFTGPILHRDHQFLAVLADHAEALARQAYQRFTGTEPNLYAAAYDQDAFHRDGYDVVKDKLFKTERLRQLWVSARRSQEMCGVALAHRLAQRLIVEGEAAADVLKHLDQAIAFAKANQLIYQLNYHDDYDATDGLCAKSRISWKRNAPHSQAPPAKLAKTLAEASVLMIPWEKQVDIALGPALTSAMNGLAEDGFPFLVVALVLPR